MIVFPRHVCPFAYRSVAPTRDTHWWFGLRSAALTSAATPRSVPPAFSLRLVPRVVSATCRLTPAQVTFAPGRPFVGAAMLEAWETKTGVRPRASRASVVCVPMAPIPYRDAPDTGLSPRTAHALAPRTADSCVVPRSTITTRGAGACSRPPSASQCSLRGVTLRIEQFANLTTDLQIFARAHDEDRNR